MVSAGLAIHIPPDAAPDQVSQLVCVLAADSDLRFGTAQELLGFAAAQGLGCRTEIQHVASCLGLLERDAEGLGVSATGRAFAALRHDVRGDVLHFLMYSHWAESEPLDFAASWAYRWVCDACFARHTVELSDSLLSQLVEDVINGAERAFASLDISLNRGVSFSKKSLQGAIKWLSGLQPPVVDPTTFRLRSYCPPELLLLAIGYSVRDESGTLETDILLTREKREAICRLCLLEPDALDRALDWMVPVFPRIIEPGTSAGYYGRFVRLHRIPSIGDVIR